METKEALKKLKEALEAALKACRDDYDREDNSQADDENLDQIEANLMGMSDDLTATTDIAGWL